MAWCLVEERERELTQRLRVKDAERAQARRREETVTPLPARVKTAQTAPPEDRRAA